MKVMLDKMIQLAANKFAGKFDKGGNPYILHCLKVMEYLHSDDDELNSIAVGHDLLEDTDVTKIYLFSLGFSGRVIRGIDCLTKQYGETTEQYLSRIKGNRDAVLVKLADLRHNSDIRRMKGLTEKDFLRLEKYQRMYHELKEHLRVSQLQLYQRIRQS